MQLAASDEAEWLPADAQHCTSRRRRANELRVRNSQGLILSCCEGSGIALGVLAFAAASNNKKRDEEEEAGRRDARIGRRWMAGEPRRIDAHCLRFPLLRHCVSGSWLLRFRGSRGSGCNSRPVVSVVSAHTSRSSAIKPHGRDDMAKAANERNQTLMRGKSSALPALAASFRFLVLLFRNASAACGPS